MTDPLTGSRDRGHGDQQLAPGGRHMPELQLSAHWGLPLNLGQARALCLWGTVQRRTCCRRSGRSLMPVSWFWPDFSSLGSGSFRLAPKECDREPPSHCHLPGRLSRSKRLRRRQRQPRARLLRLPQRRRQSWRRSRSRLQQAEPIGPRKLTNRFSSSFASHFSSSFSRHVGNRGGAQFRGGSSIDLGG